MEDWGGRKVYYNEKIKVKVEHRNICVVKSVQETGCREGQVSSTQMWHLW